MHVDEWALELGGYWVGVERSGRINEYVGL